MLSYRTEPPIAWITLDRPGARNALLREAWGELRELLARADADPEVRCLILHGAGPCFSAGGDIVEFAEIGGPDDRRAYMLDALSAYQAVESTGKPVIAAVHGVALGGGCELTMVSDIVIADATARFGTPEAGVGLIPGPGVARGLSHVNLHWMKMMVLAGEILDADQALLAGLVNRVVPAGEHLDAARELALRIAEKAPLALAVGKRLLNHASPDSYGHAADAVAVLQSTEDFQEGIAAFKEGRPPRFRGA